MKNKKKILITFVIAIIAIIITLVIINIVNKNRRNYKIEEITNFNYYTIIEDGKTGVIDTKGNVLIKPNYNTIKIPNPQKPIFVCIYDYDSSTGNYKTKVLNDKNEELFSEYEQVESIQIKEIVSSTPYEKSVLRFKKDNKYGLINFEGKVIVDAIYDEISNMSYKEGELLVKKDDKYGVINIKGVKLVDIKYDKITGDNYYTEKDKYKLGGYIVGNKTDEGYRYGYINYEGKKVLNIEYNDIYRMTDIEDDNNAYLVAEKSGQAGLLKNNKVMLNYDYQSIEYDKLNKVFVVEKNKKFGVVDIDANIILQPEYDDITIQGIYIYAQKNDEAVVFDIKGNKQEEPNYKNIAPTKDGDYYITIDKNNKYGVEDKNNKEIIPNEYIYIEYAFDKYFIVCGEDNKLGLINSNNEIVIDLQYDIVQKLEDANIIQTGKIDSNTLELYDSSIKKLISLENGKIYQGNDYIKVYSDNTSRYFKFDGTEVKNTDVFQNNVLFAKEENQKWGFVDKNGNKKVDFIYDKVTEFNEYGFAGIRVGEKWGVINSEGTVIEEPKYTFSNQIIEPSFIGSYYKVVSGYGEIYYSNEIQE